MNLSRETMGVFALAVLWLTTALIAWVGVRDMVRIARRWWWMRGRVHRVRGVIATHVTEQVGRAQSASATRRAIFFRDRSYRSEVHGGTVHLGDGSPAILSAAGGGVEVWTKKPSAPPAVGDFAVAYAQALKPRGLPITFTREVRDDAWVVSESSESLVAAIVAAFDPRRFCARAFLLSAAVLSFIIAWSALVTVLVFTKPVFGTVSTFGGVLGLAEFLAIQPLATWLRDQLLWPHQAPAETRWLDPSAARENRSSPATVPQ